MMDYDIQLEDQKGGYSPHTDIQNVQNIQLGYKQETLESERQNQNPIQQIKDPRPNSEAPTGCTKFCQIQFYEQFFSVSQLQVADRIRLSFIPTKNTFIENLDNNPDFYGPFWLLNTMIFLISSTGNLSRYFANFQKQDYLFKLQFVQYGVLVMYSFGFAFPAALYFIMKLSGVRKISLSQMICLYGYSFSCFIPIFLLCIIPVKGLQWILIAYGLVNTTMFVIMNIKDYLQEIEVAKKYVIMGIVVCTQITLFLIFKLVFFDLALKEEQ